MCQVRLQEYLEMVKGGQRLAAVKHAKKFLSTGDSTCQRQFQHQHNEDDIDNDNDNKDDDDNDDV